MVNVTPWVLYRRRVGTLGAANLASVPVWLAFWLLP
jgi:hypothetical protein